MSLAVDRDVAVGGPLKRAFDVSASLLLIIFFAPLMAIIWVTVRLTDGQGAVFKHPRVGAGGETFYCYKFRTMVPDSEDVLRRLLAGSQSARAEWTATQKLKTDPRITRVGRVLRSLSLDELPQLFNVLRGDMSIVGPRPVVESELARYGAQAADYFRARPGITGLWQVTARGSGDYVRRVALDVEYVNNWSFGRDISILSRTVTVVLNGEGSW